MTNPAGRKWEVRVVAYLVDHFPTMERRRSGGRFDSGEFVNSGDWTFECKNTKAMQLSKALDEAVLEQKHNKSRWHAAIINRRNHSIDKAYVVMTFAQLRELIRELGGP
jgi:hypothetical protein